jgi:cold shock CspA family protein/ribosome-associated translation inhibitor RaiA
MTLPVQITFRNMEDDGLEEYVRRQAAKLEHYYRGITSCRVIVEMRGRHQEGNLCHVRIDLGVPGGELLVRHEPSVHGSLQDKTITKRTKSTEVGALHKNPQRAILDAFGEMRRQLQDYARKQHGSVKERAEPLVDATVTSLLPKADHGFLATADGRQIYFHRNSVLNGHFGRLRVGSVVRFAEEAGDKGPQASSVHLVHPRQQAQAAAATTVMRKRSTTPPR